MRSDPPASDSARPDAQEPVRRARPRYDYGRPAESAGSGAATTGGATADGAGSYGATADGTGNYGARADGADGVALVCANHPDRVTHVRCRRCSRPVCPSCQRRTPVGVLCAECALELSRRQAGTAPRTVMGGAAGRNAPLVTDIIMGLCVLAFLGQTLVPGFPERLAMFVPGLALQRPWTFLTSGFLHGGALHLVVNMWALWVVGRYLEQSLGAWRYAAVFLLSVVGGHVAVLALTDANSPGFFGGTVGASGGIFGLFGALLILHRRMGAQYGQVLVLIVLNLLITFTVPGISWQGHVGGLVVGTGLTAAMFALRPTASAGADRNAVARRSAITHALLCAGVLALLLVVIAVRFALL